MGVDRGTASLFRHLPSGSDWTEFLWLKKKHKSMDIPHTLNMEQGSQFHKTFG